MSSMRYHVREMLPGDAETLQQLYGDFAARCAGPSAQKPATVFRRMARRKGNVNWVAVDDEQRVVGYVSATYEKGRRQGRIDEIVVAASCDYVAVGRPLVDRLCEVFAEKGAASILAVSVRNPDYRKIFPELGFFSIATDGIFMLAVHHVARFLHEVTPILIRRLQGLTDWNGYFQVSCGEHSVFFRRHDQEIEALIWTNRAVDIKVSMEAPVMASLLLGTLTLQDALKGKRLQMETSLPPPKAHSVLAAMFPERTFLAFDFW